MSAAARMSVLAVLVLIAGCIPSLNAIYTEDDLVLDNSIVGLWKQERGKATWEFTPSEGMSYELLYTVAKSLATASYALWDAVMLFSMVWASIIFFV